ncbi:MAG: spore protease YyaC [Bacillaceae bacterium]|nr:spore protease YyaC [Bacillaceae bacterium]
MDDYMDPVDAFPSIKISYSDDQAVEVLTENLQKRFQFYQPYSDIIALCIGTDRSTGDSLGPLVGTNLKKIHLPNFHVYGTLDHPVHAVNLQETMDLIQSEYDRPLVLAVDACLGKYSNVGKISIHSGPLKPGAGVNKQLPEVGVFHIVGIVNVGGFMEYFVLQNTRLSLVMKMADVIAHSIQQAGTDHFRKKRHTFTSIKTKLTRS